MEEISVRQGPDLVLVVPQQKSMSSWSPGSLWTMDHLLNQFKF